jgi:hypothetical protein
MKFLAALILVLASISANAGDLVLTLASKHFNANENMNEVNPGVGYRDGRWSLGEYKNSYSKTTGYVYYQLTDPYRLSSNLTIYPIVGALVGGYRLPVTPVILPVITYDVTKRVHFDITVLPPVVDKVTVIGVQARFSLGQ